MTPAFAKPSQPPGGNAASSEASAHQTADQTADRLAGGQDHPGTVAQAAFEAAIADIQYRTETKSAMIEEAMKRFERHVRRLGGGID